MLKAKLVIARKAVIYMAKPKIEPNEITASRIKLLRKACKMTQSELGQIIGRQIQAINAYENLKQSVPQKVLADIAKALDTSVEYLSGKTDNPQREIKVVYKKVRLSNCPFCGGEAFLNHDRIQCISCNVTMPFRYGLSYEDGKKIAIASWNSRKGTMK